MSGKTVLAGFIGAVEEAGVTIDPDILSGGLQRTTRQLAQVEFKVRSPDGDVTVWLAASGALREIIIAEGALKRHDHRQMAALVLGTIKTAEKIMAEGVREVTRRQLRNRRPS
ncbi:MAG: YbaB/EbfC family nucleoid-associated protein [Acidimicrobiia bacterium]